MVVASTRCTASGANKPLVDAVADRPQVLRISLISYVLNTDSSRYILKKRSPYSITERRLPELIPVLGSQPAGDVSHKPGGRLPLLSARPAP